MSPTTHRDADGVTSSPRLLVGRRIGRPWLAYRVVVPQQTRIGVRLYARSAMAETWLAWLLSQAERLVSVGFSSCVSHSAFHIVAGELPERAGTWMEARALVQCEVMRRHSCWTRTFSRRDTWIPGLLVAEAPSVAARGQPPSLPSGASQANTLFLNVDAH